MISQFKWKINRKECKVLQASFILSSQHGLLRREKSFGTSPQSRWKRPSSTAKITDVGNNSSFRMWSDYFLFSLAAWKAWTYLHCELISEWLVVPGEIKSKNKARRDEITNVDCRLKQNRQERRRRRKKFCLPESNKINATVERKHNSNINSAAKSLELETTSQLLLFGTPSGYPANELKTQREKNFF